MVAINKEKTAELIKSKCRQLDMSVKDIAKACCVSDQAVYHWFRGRKLPSLDTFALLANYYGCTIDELLVVDEIGGIDDRL